VRSGQIRTYRQGLLGVLACALMIAAREKRKRKAGMPGHPR